MGTINLASNWQLFYDSGILSRSVIPINGQYRIPEFWAPVIGAQKIVSVTVESEMARAWWRYAGRLSTHIAIDGAANDRAVLSQVELKNLNSYPVLVAIPDVGSDYLIRIELPLWLDEVTVQIWEYTGPSVGTVVYAP